ncbi:hypothetical protein DM44_4777 [Burkholderia cepacia]|jgi:hypothetical protein|uniref:hypothetical protein n=1 Tax=Burkholderia cenocepacia TaxID=95486 RepID=UPI0004F85384|nr:hypothetical protein [Burkholderia cenocepacia]AIO44790.1 hypothetical protein DM42_4003 [Burkholderia cepacia]KGC00564.1 hypothetical protein DM44_4777 [Burkholderia cepacia]MDN7662745.1 hypothetical protein [Burkholderia cenocepacia]
MFQTDQATAVSALPVPAAAGTPGYFTGGNPATGQAATILDADWLNMVQEELLNLLIAAGIAPSKTTYTQVRDAIRSIQGTRQILTDTGSANIYQAANPSPMAELPTTTGVTQFVKIKTANTGPSTYAPDGLASAPIFGMSAQPLQGGELGTGGYAILVSVVSPAFNSGNLCWVLTSSLLGALPVFPGSESQHAAQYGQLLQRTNGKAGAVAYGGSPSANWTQTRTLSFTASSNGFVIGQQTVISGQQPAGIQSTVTVSAGSSTSETDHSQLPMVDTGVLLVQAGQTVTVTGTVLADNYSGAWLPATVTLWYAFIPSN